MTLEEKKQIRAGLMVEIEESQSNLLYLLEKAHQVKDAMACAVENLTKVLVDASYASAMPSMPRTPQYGEFSELIYGIHKTRERLDALKMRKSRLS